MNARAAQSRIGRVTPVAGPSRLTCLATLALYVVASVWCSCAAAVSAPSPSQTVTEVTAAKHGCCSRQKADAESQRRGPMESPGSREDCPHCGTPQVTTADRASSFAVPFDGLSFATAPVAYTFQSICPGSVTDRSEVKSDLPPPPTLLSLHCALLT